MSVVSELLQDVHIPRMFKIRQNFPDYHIEDVAGAVVEQLSREEIRQNFKPGMRICLTCSSRGVDNLALVLKTVSNFLKDCGANPFIVPAMGSHGGATAEGQLAVAKSAGVTEEYCGCPIISCMDTVKIGTCEDGVDVYIDRHAAEADGIIVIGRVKPHTSFVGPYESGIMKMMAIGLGKQYGASVTHSRGFGEMARMVPMFGQTIINNCAVLCGLALVEDAHDRTCIVQALTREEIPLLEPELLKKAKALMPRILFDDCHVLVVDRIGKNISGDGMDPNITGRWATPYKTEGGIRAERVAVLDVTEESHGNACGAGMADACTRRVFEKMDFEMSYPNCITCKVLRGGYLPIILDSDKQAIQLCLKTCINNDWESARVIRIRDTLSLETIEISEALLEEAKANPNIEILSEMYQMAFNEDGNLF